MTLETPDRAFVRVALLAAAASLAALAPGPALADGAPVRIAVASNVAPAMRALAAEHERRTGTRVTVSVGSTGSHYAQIVQGAPFDALFAADAERPRRLEEQGVAVPGSRFTYARGRLVLWSRDPALVDAEGRILDSADALTLAIANPRLAPYGRAAREVLVARGAWARLEGRIARAENVAQAFAFVKAGHADLGFVARSHVVTLPPAEAGSHWVVPERLHAPIEQQAVLLRDVPGVRAFFEFAGNVDGAAILRAHGYEVP